MRRGGLEPAHCMTHEVRCRLPATGRSFEMGGRELDQGSKELSLFGVPTDGMPETLQPLVRFPPVPKVIQIHRVEKVLGAMPALGWKGGGRRFRTPKGMSLRMPAWVGRLSESEPVGREGPGRIARKAGWDR